MVARSEQVEAEDVEATEAVAGQSLGEELTGPAGPDRGLVAALFVSVVLVLAVALSLWAPWREEGQIAVSEYGPQVDGGAGPMGGVGPMGGAGPAAPTALPAIPTARPTVVASPAPTATTAAPVAEVTRPTGLPVRRADWLVVRDYQAHGGPGPNGAIDLAIIGNRDAVGTPIYATHDGTARVLRGNKTYGNLVAIKNGRWSTTYGHLDTVLVSEGQAVRRGDQIGTLGRTGNAPGPQLDYQVWEKVNGNEINRNPLDFVGR